MLQYSGGIGESGFRQVEKLFAGKGGLFLFLQELVHMHAVSRHLVERFRHECHIKAHLIGYLPDDPFGQGDLVARLVDVHEVKLYLKL